MDISSTLTANSGQQNYDEYLAGPKTVTVTEVRQGTAEQPVEIHLKEFPDKPFKPAKSVRRILAAAWGTDASKWAGRRLTIYGDPAVRYGGKEVGGLRVSHLSHIEKPITVALTVTRGKRAPFTVQPLPDAPAPQYAEPQPVPAFESLDEARDYYTHRQKAGASPDELQAIIAAAPPAPTTPTTEENQ